MRILSWNINGIRTLRQYHPWNTLKSCEEVLQHLEADVICFQEMKLSRATLDYTWALPGQFDGFFSFPINKGGYSGVAVYTNSFTVVPIKAEEGITGKVQPKPPLTSEERVSSLYPSAGYMGCLMHGEDGIVPSDLTYLDTEGRALVLDFGLFVLINTYCPNLTSDARMSYKMNFVYTLRERVRLFISEGREVIVLGDLNICSSPLDHADGNLASNASTWYDDRPDRILLRQWIDEEDGCMVDILRKLWPQRKGMFTCWNTRISARESNYGARVDYVLVTRGLLPWIKHGDIQPSLKGSDHCPIYIDLHDEITLESGTTLTLRQAMGQDGEPKEPPRIAAKFWDEFSGKQTSLKAFFGKHGNISPAPSDGLPPSDEPVGADDAPSEPLPQSTTSAGTTENQLTKRKIATNGSTREVKTKKLKTGQTKLSTFFSRAQSLSSPLAQQMDEDQLEADYRLAVQLSSEDGALPSVQRLLQHSDSSPHESKGKGKAWGQLLAPLQPPKCTIHGEPAKELTVTKNGPNKGKNFFICSRPLGPGYDKGRAARLREEVDHRFKCNYFKWSSEVKREALKDPAG